MAQSTRARPEPSSERVSRQMSKLGQRDTEPELIVRSILHRRGLRFRVHRRPVESINSKADLVFGPSKVAVYIDGCFWHFCPEHGSVPASNSEFWEAKLTTNRKRDRRVSQELAERGWLVLRFWEHENPLEVADAIEHSVRERR